MPELIKTERLDVLLARVADESLTQEELAELQDILSTNEAARRRYVRYLSLHHELEAQASQLDAQPTSPHHRPQLSWVRPLIAAAAGVVIGLFTASMVYGVIVRQALWRMVPLRLVNAGFEEGEGPLKPGHSRRIAEWTGSGLLARAADGRCCAQLAPVLPLKEKSRAGVLLQTLDLETMGAPLVPDGTHLVLSAEVNASHEPAPGMRQFALRVLTFSQSAREVLSAIWPDHPDAAEANVVRTLEVDGDAQTWQRLRTRLELPTGTRSVMIEISGPRTPPGTDVGAMPEFWVDEVRAALQIPRETLP